MLDIKALLNKLVGHYNNIGIYNSTSSNPQGYWTGTYSLPNNTLTSVGVNKTIPAGEWMFFAGYRFPRSATGYRMGQIYINNSAMGASLARKTTSVSALCQLHGTFIYKSDVSFTVDIRMQQNSGSAQTITWYLQAVRIK